MKLELSQVAQVLKKNAIEPALFRRLLEELNLLATPTAEPADKAPSVKKQTVIVVSDPDGHLPARDFLGWVVQIPESESPATALERLHRAAYDFNATKRGRLLPCITLGETLEHVPARFFREADAWIRTKTPVLVVRTDNIVPGTDTLLSPSLRPSVSPSSAPAAA